MMTSIYEFFYTQPAIALGWTLLHSLWQSLAIWFMLTMLLRIIPGKHSGIRYSLSVLALLMICGASVLTFSMLTPPSEITDSIALAFNEAAPTERVISASPVEKLLTHIQSAIPFMVGFWIAGTLIFISRILGGLWHLRKLKQSVRLLDNLWRSRIRQLSRQLGISREILLGESNLISVPVVMGYLKPIVIVPVGMFSGLSTEQVEAIFIHELTHIRRHDYLINIIQSVIEAFLFFNPFVWMISNLIRKEREHCCDDTVLEQCDNAKAYAHALAYLEDKQLNKTGFVLALTGNENQLLTRIKRIMERSVKHYSGRERIIPALLLIIGLICASWITIQQQDEPQASTTNSTASSDIQADTTIRKNEKSATYSRKKITTIGPDGEPREEIVENFEGDEELRSMMEDFDMDLDLNGIHDFVIPPVPDMSEFMQSFNMSFPGQFNFHPDTIPGPAMGFGPGEDWEKFAEEFTKQFQENFGDFYKDHHEDLEKMMEGLEKNFQYKFNDEWAQQMEDHAKEMQQHWLEQSEKMALQHDNLDEQMRKLESQMEDWKERDHGPFEKMEEKMKSLEANMKEFEKSLKEELVKDGYLKEDEKIQSMQWDEDGSIEINGKKIKPADEQKYKDLHKKYFKDSSGNFRYVE